MMAFIVPTLLFLTLILHGLFFYRPSKENLFLTPWFVIASILSLPKWKSNIIGHEATFLDVYNGAPWMEGNTLSYPSMQIWWKIWGYVFTHSSWGVQVVCILCASLCIQLFALLLFRTVQSKKLSIWGASLLLLHPDFASWMGHMYNVIPPLFFSLYAQILLQKKAPTSTLLASVSLSLAVLMRLDFLLLTPFFIVQTSGTERIKATTLGALLCGLGLFPILAEVPGEGERMLSFFINLPILEYWTPTLWLLLPILFLSYNKISTYTGLYILALHLVFSTFNDYGSRHVLFAVPIIIWALTTSRTRFGLAILSISILWGRVERQIIYEASEESFLQYIETHHPSLPRLTLQQAKSDGCAWIAEEEPFLSTPPRSHFNLYDPAEASAMRSKFGCIQWCSTKEDWRWSALGVRERAQRLHSLYVMEPISVVAHKNSRCILYDVRTRTR
jgi:hypothetical protein